MRTVVLVVLALGGVARAEDRKRTTEKELAATAAAMNEACGSKVKVSIAWKGFAEGDIDRYSVSSYCGAPLEKLADFCAGTQRKAIIAKKVRSFTCSFGGAGKRRLDIKQGAVEYAIDWDAGNDEDFAGAMYLEKL